MNCPNCRHDNANDARFCAQCGASLTQPATVAPAVHTSTAPAARAGRSDTRRAIVPAVLVLLLFAVGMIAAFQLIVNKTGTPRAADTRPPAHPGDSIPRADGPEQVAPSAVNVIGGAPGTGVKSGSGPGKGQDNATAGGQPIAPHDTSSGDASSPTDSSNGGQSANAVAGFLGALSSAVGGAHRHDPVDFHTLEALLPSSLSGLQHSTPTGTADDVVGIKTTSAEVDFTGPDDAHIHVSIKDATAISGLAGLAEMANAGQSEQGDSYEKNETLGGRSVHEKWDAASKHGELSLIAGQRFGVDVVGNNVGMDALKDALARIDLAKLESMKDANPITK